MRQLFLFRFWKPVSFALLLFLLAFLALFRVLLPAHAAQPVVPNTIFLDTTAANFSIATAGASGTITYTVTDLTGTLVLSGRAAVTGSRINLALSHLPDGYYTLNVLDRTTLFAPRQSVPFAIMPALSSSDSRFGMGVHFGGPYVTPLLSTLGVGSARSDLSWSQVEQAPGQYTFSPYDASLQDLQQHNLDPLLILDYNNRFYDNGQTPFDDAGMQAFANYARAAVQHYGPQLKAVEIYNEYNGIFSNGSCARKASCYARLLQYSYQAIKSVRPDVTVVGGVVFSVDLVWFTQLFQAGAMPYMDAISDHPYPLINFLSPERDGLTTQLDLLRALILHYNNGVAKPIWITELGWPTSLLNVNDRTQAQYLVRGAVLSLTAGVDKFFWYDFLNDGEHFYSTEQNYGLLRQPDAAGRYTPKPAYVAYATLIRQLAHQGYTGGGSIGGGAYAERFGNVDVLWSTGTARHVTVQATGVLTVTSMVGRTQTYTPSAGRVTLTLSEDPLYLSMTNVTSIAAS